MTWNARSFFAGALVFAAVLAGRAAEAPRHDLHLLVSLSGPGSGVIGRAGPARSGLYRLADRATFEHAGPHHIRRFHLTHDPRYAQVAHVAVLDGLLRSFDRGRLKLTHGRLSRVFGFNTLTITDAVRP